MRAILSITILLTMICYNIKTRPCYVDKVCILLLSQFILLTDPQINFFRTASFTCILWTSALVAILSDTDAAQSLGPLAVIYIILGGWIFIILMFIIIYFIYYIQPPDHIMMDDSSNNTAINLSQDPKDTNWNYSDHDLSQLDHGDNDSIRSSAARQNTISRGWLAITGISKWWYGSSNNNNSDRTYY